MDFGSVLTAMITPFDQNGEIDFAETTKIVEYLLENGTDGLVVTGTTGESPTLTHKEKLDLYKHVVTITGGRVPVIAGTGSNNTKASAELTKEAEQCGVDAIMLVTPYYNKPDQLGLYTHFKTVAASTTLPVMLYNIPGRSVAKLDADTVIRLSEIDNIVSVKDASGDLREIAKMIDQTNDNFHVYSGEDHMTLPMLAIGARGVVSVTSHIAGKEMQRMVKAFFAGDTQTAGAIHRKLVPLMDAIFSHPSPVPVKTALNHHGFHVGSVRLPLVPLDDEQTEILREKINW